MSVVTILTAILAIGFGVTGLIGFLGWRQRMHDSAGTRRPPTLPTSTGSRTPGAQGADLEGARA